MGLLADTPPKEPLVKIYENVSTERENMTAYLEGDDSQRHHAKPNH